MKRNKQAKQIKQIKQIRQIRQIIFFLKTRKIVMKLVVHQVVLLLSIIKMMHSLLSLKHKSTLLHPLVARHKKHNDYDLLETFEKSIRKKKISNQYVPKTINQQLYVDTLANKKTSIVLGLGPAGTGKSLFACIYAVKQLKNGEINKIVVTRPIIAVENEELGFLPGNIAKKMDPWTKPLFDIMGEFFQPKELKQMLCDETIEISPLAYMRGRTFKNTCIIADEMQNSTPNQMLMLLTRIGCNSKLIITGDIHQSDRCVNNGLLDLKLKLEKKKVNGMSLIQMTNNDIQRNEIISDILDLYDSTKNQYTTKPYHF